MLIVDSVGFNLNLMCVNSCKALLSIVNLINNTLFKLNKSDLFCIFADNLCFVKGDLKSVCAGEITGRCNEYAGCSVRIFGIDRNIVLYLNIMPLALVAECTNL